MSAPRPPTQDCDGAGQRWLLLPVGDRGGISARQQRGGPAPRQRRAAARHCQPEPPLGPPRSPGRGAGLPAERRRRRPRHRPRPQRQERRQPGTPWRHVVPHALVAHVCRPHPSSLLVVVAHGVRQATRSWPTVRAEIDTLYARHYCRAAFQVLLDRYHPHPPASSAPGSLGDEGWMPTVGSNEGWMPTVGSIDAADFPTYARPALERLGIAPGAVPEEAIAAVDRELAPLHTQVGRVGSEGGRAVGWVGGREERGGREGGWVDGRDENGLLTREGGREGGWEVRRVADTVRMAGDSHLIRVMHACRSACFGVCGSRWRSRSSR